VLAAQENLHLLRIFFSGSKKHHGGYGEKAGRHGHLSGELRNISAIEYVDQNPIGRSSRSNPATYLKAFDDIRSLFASQKLAKLRGYKPGYFLLIFLEEDVTSVKVKEL